MSKISMIVSTAREKITALTCRQVAPADVSGVISCLLRSFSTNILYLWSSSSSSFSAATAVASSSFCHVTAPFWYF